MRKNKNVKKKMEKVVIATPLNDLIERVKKEPAIPLIWDGIKENSVGFIVGPAKSCKTIFCENLGLSIASGATDFLGKPLTVNNRKVLFISLEEFYSNRTERNSKQVEKLKRESNKGWEANYIVVNENIPRYINTPEDWKTIEDLISEVKPGVVIIDSLSRLYEGSIEDSAIAKKLMEKLRELTSKFKIVVIVIHHTHKLNNQQQLTIHNMAGSRIIAQEADFMIGMNRTPDGTSYLKPLAYRYADDTVEKVNVFKLDDDLWMKVIKKEYEIKLLSVSDGRRDETNSGRIYEYFQQKAPGGEIVTYSQLEVEFVESKTMSKQTLFNQLEKLVNDGMIKKTKKGEYKIVKKE